jgi:antitoxin component YwqK of YwqJK toxin-antitoxin module
MENQTIKELITKKAKNKGFGNIGIETGQYREKGSYVSGIKHGHWTSYHEKGSFIDSDGNYSKGKQHGTVDILLRNWWHYENTRL